MERDEVIRLVFDVSQSMARTYLDSPTSWATETQREQARAGSAAAHNTGFFILQGLGVSHAEFKAMLAADVKSDEAFDKIIGGDGNEAGIA